MLVWSASCGKEEDEYDARTTGNKLTETGAVGEAKTKANPYQPTKVQEGDENPRQKARATGDQGNPAPG